MTEIELELCNRNPNPKYVIKHLGVVFTDPVLGLGLGLGVRKVV
jgi:hypothetical protein